MSTPRPPADSRTDPLSEAPSATGDETAAYPPSPSAPTADFLATPQAPGELGRLAHYRIVRQLGAGGMGVVFEAEDTTLSRPVALKVMKGAVADNPAARERFVREARAAAAVKHDHIVTIYQVGEDRGVPFIALEFLKGVPLDQWLAKSPRPPLPHAVRIARQVADGLAGAHERGLIHRDIKPANVWLEAPKGRAKILDFGLARAADDAHLTREGAVVGTPSYMAPEQARGAAVDHRTDLWSLGVLLYRMCTGEQPFKGATTMAVLTALAVDTPAPVREKNPAVPPPLADLIHGLLSKDPAARPASAEVVAKLLRLAERDLAARASVPSPRGPLPVVDAGETVTRAVPAVPPEAPPAGPPAKPRRRWLVAAGLLGLLAAVAAGVVVTVRSRDGKDTTVEVPAGSKVTVGPDGNVAVVLPPKADPVPPAAPAFFNGKDLTGWTQKGDVFRVENGELVAALPAGTDDASLSAARPYRDFELTFDVKDGPKTFPLVEGGLILRNPEGHWDRGLEIQLTPSQMGRIQRPGGGGPPQTPAGDPLIPAPDAVRAVTANDYSSVAVRVVGSRVTVTVNGVIAVDGEVAGLPAEGQIKWHLHRPGGRGRSRFVRNVRFTDLSPPPPAAGPVDLLALVDPGADAVKGTWERRGATLVAARRPQGEGSVLGFPYRPASEYDMTAVFTPTGYGPGVIVSVALVRGRQSFRAGVGWVAPDQAGFCALGSGFDRGPVPPELVPAAGRRQTLRAEVRRDRVTLFVDGREVRELTARLDELHTVPPYAQRDATRLGLMTTGSEVTFHAVTVTEVTGGGAVLRGDPTFFNGKDLTGWEPGGGEWRVENGEVIGTAAGQPGTKRLRFGRPVRDFEASFEARTVRADPTQRGEAALRFRRAASGKESVGIELAPFGCGTVFQIADGNKYTALARLPDGFSARLRADDYNAFTVRVAGRRITVAVNGTTVSDAEYDGLPDGDGFVWDMLPTCAELRLRNVRFADLSPPAPAFFDGKTLAGWTGDPKVWRAEDGAIVGTRPAGNPAYQYLTLDRPVGDFELAFEARETPPMGGSLRVRADPAAGHGAYILVGRASVIGNVSVPSGPPAAGAARRVKNRRPEVAAVARPDDYNAVVVRVVGNRVTTTVNGVTAVDDTFDLLPTGSLSWQLFSSATELRVRNVRFTELSAKPPAASGTKPESRP